MISVKSNIVLDNLTIEKGNVVTFTMLLLCLRRYLDFYPSVSLTPGFGGISCHRHGLSISYSIDAAFGYAPLNQ